MRVQDITSTDVSVLFGVSPYKSALQLWAEKKNKQIIQIEENERIFSGRVLEPSIAIGAAEKWGWKIAKADRYVRLPEHRIGSSFDYIIDNGKDVAASMLEIKNVDGFQYWEKWIERDGIVEPPPHILFQLQHQLLVAGVPKGYIVALVGGNKWVKIEQEADEKVHQAILKVVAEFWRTIEANEEPAIDWNKDADFICSRYSSWRENETLDMTEDVAALAKEYNDALKAVKAAELEKTKAKAKILSQIGEANKVKGDAFTISRGKQFRVNPRKVKAK
jgi:putative phage-type endonuclease